jgi:hypothetical protein
LWEEKILVLTNINYRHTTVENFTSMS